MWLDGKAVGVTKNFAENLPGFRSKSIAEIHDIIKAREEQGPPSNR